MINLKPAATATGSDFIKMRKIISTDNLFNLAAEKFVEIAKDSIAKRNQFTVALSGGSTPKKLYAMLAEEPFRSQIEWDKIQFFFGDERMVLPDDEQSNFRMANESLFSKVEIPQENIHRFQTEKVEPKLIAEEMENEIQTVFQLQESEFPRFDLIFLGMGDDGHTASLFPETEALKEDTRLVTENYVPKFETFRLTFTYPTINNSRNIIFLISGNDKAEVLKEVLHGEYDPHKLPSQSIKPIDGNLIFLTDIEGI